MSYPIDPQVIPGWSLETIAGNGTDLIVLEQPGVGTRYISPLFERGRTEDGCKRIACIVAGGGDLLVKEYPDGPCDKVAIKDRDRRWSLHHAELKRRFEPLARYHHADVATTWGPTQGALAVAELLVIAHAVGCPIRVTYYKDAQQERREYTLDKYDVVTKRNKDGSYMIYVKFRVVSNHKQLRCDRIHSITPLAPLVWGPGAKWRIK